MKFRDEAADDRGFVLLRGLPVEDWPVEDVVIAYWGLGAYWGKAQPQNRLHHLFGSCQSLSALSPTCLPAQLVCVCTMLWEASELNSG